MTDQADQRRDEVRIARKQAARTMLAALKALNEWEAQQGRYEAPCWDMMRDAIIEAEAAGIKTGEDDDQG